MAVGIQSGLPAPRWMLVEKAGGDLQCSFLIKLSEVAGLLLIV